MLLLTASTLLWKKMKKKRSVFAGSYEKCKELYAISFVWRFVCSTVCSFTHSIWNIHSTHSIRSWRKGRFRCSVFFFVIGEVAKRFFGKHFPCKTPQFWVSFERKKWRQRLFPGRQGKCKIDILLSKREGLQSSSLLKVTRNFLFACGWLRFGLARSSLRERGDGGRCGYTDATTEGEEERKAPWRKKGSDFLPPLPLPFRCLPNRLRELQQERVFWFLWVLVIILKWRTLELTKHIIEFLEMLTLRQKFDILRHTFPIFRK